MSENKYLSLNGLTQYDVLIKEKIAEGDSNSINSSKSYAESYISSEINKLIDGTTTVAKAIFATNASSATKATNDGNENEISSTYETKTDASIKLNDAKSYTDTKVASLASTTVVNNKIDVHNTSTSAHNDIRALIIDLTTKLNNFLDVDDTTSDQLSEILTLIENNKGTLESLTTTKVNVSDIVNNLTTNSASKVLSAAQGVVIKSLIDTLQEELDSHTHDIADVTGLQSALDSKALVDHGTHVTYSTIVPTMDGTASVGAASTVARSDHKHPTDTSRASKTEFDNHTANTTAHITSTERTNWNTAATIADYAQTRADAAYELASSKVDSLSDLGITATATELNYMDGVTSNVQTQLNDKAGKSTATTSTAGLMSATDKTKLNYSNIAYGTCSTYASTATKVITISGNTNWSLSVGSIIMVKFTYTNTAVSPKFNVNGTGDKNVFYDKGVITSSNLHFGGSSDRPMMYMYNGTNYVFLGWSWNNIYMQNNEPLDAEDGSLWIDLDAVGSVTSGGNSGSSSGGGTSGDLSSYALKSEIPTKVSQLINDSGYATEDYIVSYVNETILGGIW